MLIQIKHSILERPIDAVLMAMTILLYCINNSCLKENSDGQLHFFLVCYFNDLICPLFFLPYVNILLRTKNKELTSLASLLCLCFAASLVWEFFAPAIKTTAVTDVIDIVFYLLGSIVYWGILTISVRRRE